MAEFIPGTSVVIETWDGYPFKQPQINKITYTAIPEDANRYIAVETGQVQYAALVSSLEMGLAAENSELSTIKGSSLKFLVFIFNCQQAPFDNVNVRRALAYALDRDSFCALAGGRDPVSTPFFGGYDDLYSVSDNMPTYDLDKAKQLLEEEGYNSSNPLKFELVYWFNEPGLELYQSALKSIGVDVTLKQVEFSVYLSKEGPGDFSV